MHKQSFITLSGWVFCIVSIGHLLRVLNMWDLNIAGVVIPLWASWVAVFFIGWLAFTAFSLRKKGR